MSFTKSILISAAIHGALIALIPGIGFRDDTPEWVEVSLITFPDTRERVPDMPPGDEVPPEPLRSLPDPEPPDIPDPPEDAVMGVPMEESHARMPEFDEERDISPVRSEPRQRPLPGRREREGVLDTEGTDAEEIVSGPVSRRNILRKIKPDYPAWAEEAGVEGEVKLRFWVSPEGRVTEVELERTSGYPDFDSRAMEALKKYIFSPLSADEERKDQWGTITIMYRL